MAARSDAGTSDGAALTRRSFLARSAAGAGAVVTFPGARALAPAAEIARCRRSFRTSLSVSPFTEGVLADLVVTDGRCTARTVKEVQQLFVRDGATEVYCAARDS